MEIKPQAVVLPTETDHLEQGKYGPVLPRTPACYGLGRNGSYAVFRKLHQNVAEFRHYLKDNSTGREDEELVAAKIMGRRRSGAPLVPTPFR
ncbi:hypothetical protein [Kitasatospora sp. NPDC017646]|uniref:hypothetical protein n=1 Tax=Kitasatospora sp. NPDC017646 TaxID=3364024 RepID=UPI0037A0F074